jgi:hypothetical protein
MNSVSLRQVASVLAALCAAAVGASLSVGCSGAPDQAKAEPIAIDQSLVCSAVKGGGGDGCGGGTGGTPPPPLACSYPGAACCGTVCSGPLTCVGGMCESFASVTDTGYPAAEDADCQILATDIPVASDLPSGGCTLGIQYQHDPSSGSFYIWACEASMLPAVGCYAILPVSAPTKLPASRCFGAQLTSQYALVAACTPDMMGGTGPGVIQPRP